MCIRDRITKELAKMDKKISKYYSPNGMPVGEISNKLSTVARSHNSNNSTSTLSSIKELKTTQISLNDNSKVMNTELLHAIQTNAMFSILESIAKTG